MQKKAILNYIFLSLASSIIFSGCTSTTDPKISFAPPVYVEQMPEKEDYEDFGNLGSIYGTGEKPLFSDRKAMKKNDLVTVIINQSATSSSSAQKQLSENSALALGGPSFTTDAADGNSLQSTLNGINKFTSLGVGLNSDNTYSGSGSNQRSESFTTTISARIIKVLKNGNYFIEGSREILLNGEKQTIRVSGVIRPFDIDNSNTIDSQYIADARIMYDTEGDLHKSTEQGWGSKIIQSVWPF